MGISVQLIIIIAAILLILLAALIIGGIILLIILMSAKKKKATNAIQESNTQQLGSTPCSPQSNGFDDIDYNNANL